MDFFKKDEDEDIEQVSRLVNKIKEIENEKSKKEQQEIEAIKEQIKKDDKITLRYREGSSLSAWIPDSNADYQIMSELKALRYVSGWGDRVENEVEKLKSFKEAKNGEQATVSYKEVKKHFEDIETEKEAKQQQEADEKNKERQEIFKKAKETGKKQLLKTYSFDADDEEEDECGTCTVRVYAMPDGSTKEEESCSY